jgi:hypothetical protein
MGQETKREYLAAIRKRYLGAGRRYKRLILDEFCKVCGYHRKHAIRLLSWCGKRPKRKPGRPARYGESERKVLEVVWLNSNRPCSKRLKAALPIWLPHFERQEGALPAAVRDKLLAISPRSLDRLMKPVRRQHGTRGRCGTRPGTLLRHQIPIKTEHADVTCPGVMEADTVAHCGNSLDGSFVWSLTLTDVFSGWTANRAVWNKGYEGICHALANIEEQLPFRLTGFHSDNGGEFLNYHLVRYFREHDLPVAQTRSRPYHKNDTARVEQKNYTHVRLLLGYSRIENPELLAPINELYRAWEFFNNFFSPCLKLVEKTKKGSHYYKRYDTPQSPYQRLMASPAVTELQKTVLTEQFANLNPFALRRHIDHQQNKILRQVR